MDGIAGVGTLHDHEGRLILAENTMPSSLFEMTDARTLIATILSARVLIAAPIR
jgi:hypothetical protein